MIKRLGKSGNRNALFLDKAILDLMGIKPRALVQVILRNGSLIITPVDPNPVSEAKFKRCLDKVMRTRGDLLKRLAKQ